MKQVTVVNGHRRTKLMNIALRVRVHEHRRVKEG
jgi:hypothetical protein